MCGIIGILAAREVNQSLFDGLTALQHRGQDAAGIATFDGERIHLCKGNGLVRDVIRTRHMLQLKGRMGMAHVRYPTSGSHAAELAQPFYVNSPYGITLAHNGNLTNTKQLHDELVHHDHRHLNTDSDSEILLNVFAHALAATNKWKITSEDIFNAIAKVHERCSGAYAVVAMIAGIGMVAFRDPNGIRPLIYGKKETEQGTEYMVASESAVINIAGFTVQNDIAPGEAIFIDQNASLFRAQCAPLSRLSPCLFEYVYLARPDSIIDHISVYKVRLRLGECLAEKIQREYAHLAIDVVMPIPDTSRTAASVLARCLGKTFREGFVKNRYIGRTFIMPGQNKRRKSVRQKLNCIAQEFQGKNVLLVDDSIVRGTTSKEIIQMAREAGAKQVYFASTAPPVRYPNVYGIDMPSAKSLIAHERSIDEIAELIDADALIYQDIEVLISAARECNPNIKRFEDSIFTGNYITNDVKSAYLQDLEATRLEELVAG